jgi:hypothetical protein
VGGLLLPPPGLALEGGPMTISTLVKILGSITDPETEVRRFTDIGESRPIVNVEVVWNEDGIIESVVVS